MIKKVVDFDRFIAEKERDQIQIVFRGRTYTIFSEVPAIVPITIARAAKLDEKDGRYQQMIFRAVDSIFGKEAVDQMCEDGATANEMIELIQKVFQTINGAGDDESEELTDEDSHSTVAGDKAKK